MPAFMSSPFLRIRECWRRRRNRLPTPLDVSGLAELTGGRSVYADETNYEPLFRALAEEVTSAYVLAFYPPEQSVGMASFTILELRVQAG